MPDKLNQSLDQILSERRGNKNLRTRRRPGAKASVAAPTNGVTKKTRPAAKKPDKAAPPTGPAAHGESKIQVSNLPIDVTEVQIKEYFSTTVGSVKKVLLSYGPNGKSRGVATISFSRTDSAAKAAKELDGLKVDSRPMKIEVLLAAKEAPAPVAPKSLSDRVQKPAAKDKPKPATATKGGAAAKGARGRGRGGRGGKDGKTGRAKPKTAEELDQEMADYFVTSTNGTADAGIANGGAVQPAANGDVGMDDDVIA